MIYQFILILVITLSQVSEQKQKIKFDFVKGDIKNKFATTGQDCLVNSFIISRTPISKSQYLAILEKNGINSKQALHNENNIISDEECMNFCKLLNKDKDSYLPYRCRNRLGDFRLITDCELQFFKKGLKSEKSSIYVEKQNSNEKELFWLVAVYLGKSSGIEF